MTNNETMPNEIWVHWTLDYVSDVNEDGQCTKYHRAQPPIEGLREAVDRCENKSVFSDWLVQDINIILQAAKRQLESEG